MQKIKIPYLLRLILFALMMSFLTSSTVSGVTVLLNIDDNQEFLKIWVSSILNSWPLVFFLIIIFVPILNKVLNFFFIIKENK